MARLRAESAAGGRWIPATRAGGRSALLLLLLLGAVLTPQDSMAQLLTTPGSLESEAIRKPQNSVAQLLTTPGSLESEGKALEEYGQRIELCWHNYTDYMDSVKGDWCDWTVISRPYSYLQNCLEQNADDFHLGFPNPMAEEFILETHHIHFANCSLVQPTLSDPPEDVLLAMIIAPICLIPFLVTLVVWKSKDNETQA
ncbi:receptor activity-modifying protein 2 isoform X2 [Sturnira hondurensis]|uniref:receptor activity-modifying protein 2 isoform X2 n=1 Tax=Sturnira hondurensis TaxID=192404 RepID=UPI00187A907C|nr:receptor activity-modifying protein 2 isoform X2 [Sturnira hondurensis]